MKVIFITDSYFPNPSPNAICVSKLKAELEKRDINVEIVALRTFYDSTFERYRFPNIHFVEPNRAYSSLFKAVTKNDTKKISLLRKLFRLRGALYGFFWPLMSTKHVSHYVKMASKLIRNSANEKIIVIGVYKSLEAALAGIKIKQTFKHVTYILYTLDSIANSNIPTIYGNKKIAYKSILRWEHKLFKSYDFIYMMYSHRQTYSDKYYDKFRSKFRFADIPLFEPIVNHESLQSVDKKPRHLIFTGSLSKTTADPSYFFKLIEFINDSDIVVDFYGICYDDTILSAIQKSRYAFYHGTLYHDEIKRIQNQADILLNFGNFTPCGIPCKIFEYFSTAKPIISCYKIDEDASKQYMEDYPNALLIDERLSVKENANKLKEFLSKNHYAVSDKINETYLANTPAATIDMIMSDTNYFIEDGADLS